jgi:uncharacterized damage-inducible protein DinB
MSSLTSNQAADRLFLDESRRVLAKAHEKIVHCLEQLSEDQIHWRPFEKQNSIANLILHLCGNMRQWIISGVGGAIDVRHRPSEFSDRARYSRQQLLDKLAQMLREADAALARLDPASLTQSRRIQAFDTSVLGAILQAISHFVGHSQEIIYITRLQLREAYKFKFVPTKEQGGE